MATIFFIGMFFQRRVTGILHWPRQAKTLPLGLGEKSAAPCAKCARIGAEFVGQGEPMGESVFTQPRAAAASAHTLAERSSYKWWVTWTMMLGAFLFALDTTIVNIAIPKIVTSIGADLNQIQWVLIIYMIGMALVMPTVGWLSDLLGHKWLYTGS